jgi:Arc/MetJ-type ribon-helix-helix transcriptional regulator
MTIHLPEDLEAAIQAEVQSGRFASMDEAMAEAARLLLRYRQAAAPTSDELNRQLLADGLISKLPDPAADDTDDLPIPLDG